MKEKKGERREEKEGGIRWVKNELHQTPWHPWCMPRSSSLSHPWQASSVLLHPLSSSFALSYPLFVSLCLSFWIWKWRRWWERRESLTMGGARRSSNNNACTRNTWLFISRVLPLYLSFLSPLPCLILPHSCLPTPGVQRSKEKWHTNLMFCVQGGKCQ